MIRFANAKNSGVAKNSSMIVPCMVNSWLYCSGERNCRPGRASSARMSSAMNPPIMKNTNDVTRYIRPICFASVVRSSRANAEPLTGWCTGQGLVTIGLGATVVTKGLLRLLNQLASQLREAPGDRQCDQHVTPQAE